VTIGFELKNEELYGPQARMLVVPVKESREGCKGCESRLEPAFGTEHPPVGLDLGGGLSLELKWVERGWDGGFVFL
jgi:hypothetical protein